MSEWVEKQNPLDRRERLPLLSPFRFTCPMSEWVEKQNPLDRRERLPLLSPFRFTCPNCPIRSSDSLLLSVLLLQPNLATASSKGTLCSLAKFTTCLYSSFEHPLYSLKSISKDVLGVSIIFFIFEGWNRCFLSVASNSFFRFAPPISSTSVSPILPQPHQKAIFARWQQNLLHWLYFGCLSSPSVPPSPFPKSFWESP